MSRINIVTMTAIATLVLLPNQTTALGNGYSPDGDGFTPGYGYPSNGSASGEGTRIRHKPARASARAKPTQSAPPRNPTSTSVPPSNASYGSGATCSPVPSFGPRRLSQGRLPWCGGGQTG